MKNIYAQSIAGMALNISSQAGKEGTWGNTKLFEYMEAGIPVICSDSAIWKRIVEENDCGIAVEPLNGDTVKDAIQYLFCNIGRAREMGMNGRKAVISKYNWIQEEKKLYCLYENISGAYEKKGML